VWNESNECPTMSYGKKGAGDEQEEGLDSPSSYFSRGASANGIWHAACGVGKCRGVGVYSGPDFGMPIYIESSSISQRVHQNFKLVSVLN